MLCRPAKREAYRTFTGLVFGLLTIADMTGLRAGTTAEWKGGDSNWEDAAMWGGTLPSGTTEARVNGTKEKPGQVTLAHADVLVNHLSVADGGNSLASMILDGSTAVRRHSADRLREALPWGLYRLGRGWGRAGRV